MKYISPIIQKNNNTQRIMKKTEHDEFTIRKIRSDKKHAVKFPITEHQNTRIKSLCSLTNRKLKAEGKQTITQTQFNTFLLEFGLNNQHLIDYSIEYKDNKRYLHTKLNEIKYEEIGGPYGLSNRYNLSNRKIVYFIVISILYYLERGGEIEQILQ